MMRDRRHPTRLLSALALAMFASSAWAQSDNPDCYNGRLTCVTIVAPCTGVEIGGRCINDPTPQQRAQAAEEQRRLKEQRDREQRERERLAAEHQRKVDEVVGRLGPQRRAEAERFVQMQEAAAAARPKLPAKPAEKASCTTTTTQEPRKQVFVFMSGDRKTYKTEGRAEMIREVAMACEGGVMTGFQCKGGGAFGFFTCPTTFTCPVKKTVCTGTGSKVSPQ